MGPVIQSPAQRTVPPTTPGHYLPKPGEREYIKPPKFADKFARLDFQAKLMPVIALYPIPETAPLQEHRISVCGLECTPRSISWESCKDLERVRIKVPLICQIFNWVETVEWEGIRLADFLAHSGVEMHPEGFVGVYSQDGQFFEGFSVDEANDPRMLLATTMNGQPLPLEHGGPVRLVAPFLQGYKSVKWVNAIRATRHDPVGIKRLLAQSKTGRLGTTWQKQYAIVPPAGRTGDPEWAETEETKRLPKY